MSELQNEGGVQDEQPTIENQDTGAELATDSGAVHEQKTDVEPGESQNTPETNNDAIRKAINKRTFEARQAQRERDQYKERLAEYEKKERENLKSKFSKELTVPTLNADPLDDDYDDKVAQHNRNIAAYSVQIQERAAFEAQQQQQQQIAQAQQQQQQQEQMLIQQKRISTYAGKATELKITPKELESAGEIVGDYGLSDGVTNYILEHPEGPLITKYLAGNATEGLALANMNPYQAGVYIEGIKSKIEPLKGKQTNTPPPTEELSGAGAIPDQNKYPNSKGATFT